MAETGYEVAAAPADLVGQHAYRDPAVGVGESTPRPAHGRVGLGALGRPLQEFPVEQNDGNGRRSGATDRTCPV
jgi:hypothetical protein